MERKQSKELIVDLGLVLPDERGQLKSIVSNLDHRGDQPKLFLLGFQHLWRDAIGLQDGLDQAVQGEKEARSKQVAFALLRWQAIHDRVAHPPNRALALILIHARPLGDQDEQEFLLRVVVGQRYTEHSRGAAVGANTNVQAPL